MPVAHGVPVYVWNPAGRELRCASDKEEVGHFVCWNVTADCVFSVANTTKTSVSDDILLHRFIRAIILAAAPGEKLPYYPEPQHTFSKKGMSLTVVADEIKYEPCITRMEYAPFRTITVRDSMSDLPVIKNGARQDEISYGGDAESHFQRMVCVVSFGDFCGDLQSFSCFNLEFLPPTAC